MPLVSKNPSIHDPKSQQFTLNPNGNIQQNTNKFQSVYQGNNNDDDEVD
jgi:hypothetical protein